MKLKTTAITPRGEFKITLLETNNYQITHHSLPTHTVTGDNELLAIIGVDIDNDGKLEIKLIAAEDGAHIWLNQDTRHGVTGWRGSRYVPVNGSNHKLEWDEWYLFFPTLRETVEAFCKKNAEAEEARKKALSRF